MLVQVALLKLPANAVLSVACIFSRPLSARKNAAVLSPWRWPSITLPLLTLSICDSANTTVAIRNSITTAVTIPRCRVGRPWLQVTETTGFMGRPSVVPKRDYGEGLRRLPGGRGGLHREAQLDEEKRA